MRERYKLMRLAELRDEHCCKCSLHKSSKHVCILGRGSVMASTMLIGEAPGAAEAGTGKPFMGKAGKLLNRILENMDMSNVYISNAVRCRPPDNRNPTKGELNACNSFLRGEIKIVKPKLIILLGRVAVKAFGFDSSVGPSSTYFYCGPWIDAVVKATWHPAYYLRNKHTNYGKLLLQNIKEALELGKDEIWKTIH